MPRAVRAPLFLFGAGIALVAFAFLLDLGPRGARDAALVIGSYALYVLLPVASIWLVVAYLWSRRR